jgi:hypothetical protein
LKREIRKRIVPFLAGVDDGAILDLEVYVD